MTTMTNGTTNGRVKLRVLYEDGVPCLCAPALGLRLELTPGEAEYVGRRLATIGRRAGRPARGPAGAARRRDIESDRHDESLRQLRREVAEQTLERLAAERKEG